MFSMSKRRYIEPRSPSSKFFVTCRSMDVYPVPPTSYVNAVHGAPFSKSPVARQVFTVCGNGLDHVSLLASWMPHGRSNEPVATSRCLATALDVTNRYSEIEDWSNA